MSSCFRRCGTGRGAGGPSAVMPEQEPSRSGRVHPRRLDGLFCDCGRKRAGAAELLCCMLNIEITVRSGRFREGVRPRGGRGVVSGEVPGRNDGGVAVVLSLRHSRRRGAALPGRGPGAGRGSVHRAPEAVNTNEPAPPSTGEQALYLVWPSCGRDSERAGRVGGLSAAETSVSPFSCSPVTHRCHSRALESLWKCVSLWITPCRRVARQSGGVRRSVPE